MTKELWLNLPVKDVKRSKEFFTKLGFTFNTTHGDSDESACLLVGTKNVVVMLFAEPTFKGFVQNEITDTSKSSEILLSFDTESVAEVDEMAEKVREAGGTIYAAPAEIQGFMYGFCFIDLDGHRWNALYMDMSKMPQA
jgi:predicted lactoylglutathione lyase